MSHSATVRYEEIGRIRREGRVTLSFRTEKDPPGVFFSNIPRAEAKGGSRQENNLLAMANDSACVGREAMIYRIYLSDTYADGTSLGKYVKKFRRAILRVYIYAYAPFVRPDVLHIENPVIEFRYCVRECLLWGE